MLCSACYSLPAAASMISDFFSIAKQYLIHHCMTPMYSLSEFPRFIMVGPNPGQADCQPLIDVRQALLMHHTKPPLVDCLESSASPSCVCGMHYIPGQL